MSFQKEQNDNNKDNIPFYFFIIGILVFFITLLALSTKVQAQELEDEYTNTDLEQDERLNAIEIRLEELGYKISDTENALVLIDENQQIENEEKLIANQYLELMLIGMNQQLNIEETRNEQKLADDELLYLYQDKILEHNEKELLALDDIKQETVSGNTLVSDFDSNVSDKMDSVSATSMEQFNSTLLSTNKLLSYLFVLLLMALVLMIAFGIGKIIHNITNKFVN